MWRDRIAFCDEAEERVVLARRRMSRHLLLTTTSLVLGLAACGRDPMPAGDDVGDDAPSPDGGGDPGPDSGPPPQGVVQCETDLPAATEGTCDVASGSSDTAVVVRGDVLGDGV